MITLQPKKDNKLTVSGKMGKPAMGYGWSRPALGRGGKHRLHTSYDRRQGKAVPRD
jgi:hypothetical protein